MTVAISWGVNQVSSMYIAGAMTVSVRYVGQEWLILYVTQKIHLLQNNEVQRDNFFDIFI